MRSYDVESRPAARRILDTVKERFRVTEKAVPPHRITYYDTFDGRIHRDGGTLAVDPSGEEPLLSWTSYEGAVRHRLRTTTAPAFSWDFPPGEFRDAITGIIQMRRLFPRVQIDGRGQSLSVLDGNEKTVLRIDLLRRFALEPDRNASRHRLPLRLELSPIRGYDRAYREAVSLVEDDLGISPAECGVLALALKKVNREPGGHSSKLRVDLDPAMRAGEAARHICRTLLGTVLANEAGTRADLDTEFLHDFRVAVRRTRTCLSQMKQVFPADVVERFGKEFSWLGEVTGPTRDLDVYLLKIGEYRDGLPEAVREDLQPLEQFLVDHQRAEQGRLAEALESKRYRNLVRDWRKFLDQPKPGRSPAAGAGKPIGTVAAERISRRYHRMQERGAAISPGLPTKELHRLRIDGKKLRYLLEFFRSLYREGEVEKLVKVLKQLQDNLGDINDFQVQQDTLARYAGRMMEEGLATPGSILAMGRLVEQLQRRGEEERRRFRECFAGFSDRRTQRALERLLKPAEKAGR